MIWSIWTVNIHFWNLYGCISAYEHLVTIWIISQGVYRIKSVLHARQIVSGNADVRCIWSNRVCTVRDIILFFYHQLQIIFQSFSICIYIPPRPISLAWTILIGKTCVSVRKIYNKSLLLYDCKLSSRITQFLPVLTSIYSSPVIISWTDCIWECSDP